MKHDNETIILREAINRITEIPLMMPGKYAIEVHKKIWEILEDLKIDIDSEDSVEIYKISKKEIKRLFEIIKDNLYCWCHLTHEKSQKQPCACSWTPIENWFNQYIDLKENE